MSKNKKFFIISNLCVAAILIFSLAACTAQEQVSPTTQQVSSDTTAAETTVVESSQVILKNNKFQPDTLTVQIGATVTWVNQDGYIHTVTSGTSPSDRSGLFDSGNLNGGETFSFTFDTAGTYDYFCIPHFSLGMIGKIIVTE